MVERCVVCSGSGVDEKVLGMCLLGPPPKIARRTARQIVRESEELLRTWPESALQRSDRDEHWRHLHHMSGHSAQLRRATEQQSTALSSQSRGTVFRGGAERHRPGKLRPPSAAESHAGARTPKVGFLSDVVSCFFG